MEEPEVPVEPGPMVPPRYPGDGSPLPPLRDVARLKQPSTIGGMIYLVVLGTALVGVGIAAFGAWRTGVCWLGGSLLLAALGRLVLPGDDAGMLGVRRRRLDSVLFLAVGIALIVLAVTIPNQPV